MSAIITAKGIGVIDAVAIGNIYLSEKKVRHIIDTQTENPEREAARFDAAVAAAAEQLRELRQSALCTAGEQEAAIFEIHEMMLNDPDLTEPVLELTGMGHSAEYAVEQATARLAGLFSALEDDYMRERAADVRDISNRLLDILSGNTEYFSAITEPSIIFAEDLTPSEIMQIDKERALGFVVRQGSLYSHAAILARTMGIPAIVGIELDLSLTCNALTAAIDGETGIVYLNPDPSTLEALREKQERDKNRQLLLQQLKGKQTVTSSGQEVKLYANIGNESDLSAALENDAEGIGLFRSEFLYLEKGRLPTEDEQFQTYRRVLEAMSGKEVIVRTLDIGADKQADWLALDKEENPALGCRAIRVCLRRPELFKTQLRALYRASVYGRLSVMFPMIASLEEVRNIGRVTESVRKELMEEAHPYRDIPLGIMIETPAAAIISDLLASEVDFFSIGTNDLTQYLLAMDRQNPKLGEFYDEQHPAVLRVIEMISQNAHKAGIWVGICGELAAKPEMTEFFLKTGIDELSVAPPNVLPLRKKIREF